MKQKYFTKDQMKTIYHALDQDPDNEFYLMIELLAQTGMRVDELTRIQLSDVNRREYTITIHKASKGSESRTLPLGHKLTMKIIRLSDKFFLGEHDLIYLMCAKRSESVSHFRDYLRFKFRQIKSRYFPAQRIPCLHGFRHTKAKQIYDSTGDIYMVKRFLGHSSVISTEYYLPSIQNDKLMGFTTR